MKTTGFFKALMICACLFSIAWAQNVQDSFPLSYDSILAKVNNAQVAYNTFSSRSKMTWDDGSEMQDFQANVRMVKDSLVWMSLTGAMGIEGVRVLVTPDSIRIMNKLTAEYMARGFAFIESWVMFPVSFNMLQQVITGGKISLPEKAGMVKTEDSAYVLYSESNSMLEKIWVDTVSYTVKKILLKDKMLKQQMSVIFEGYNAVTSGKPELAEKGVPRFSYKRNVKIERDGITMNLDMEVQKVRINEAQTYPFEVNDKYKRIE